jgi:glutathione synthase/RimK-type ligase-like ATP-grasp enzyme
MKYLFEFAQYSEQPAHTASFGVLGDLGKKSKFGEQTGYFKSLMEQAQAEGMDAFVFTEFSPEGVTAWNLDGDDWHEAKKALPSVFYDRSFRKKDCAGKTSNTRALCSMGCTPLNSPDFRKLALDKHLMYQNLADHSIDGMGLPHTEKYSDSQLIPFLQKHPSAILKPRFGSGGHGIIKLSKSDAGYGINYKENSIECQEPELRNRINEIRQKGNASKRLYIIQECIDLPKYNNGVFDVRVIYQKGKGGSPLRTGMAVRLAAPNKVTANLHQGGSRETLGNVLGSLFNQDMNGEIADSIRNYSKDIFKILDDKVGPIGEVGIDFLIDQGGKVYLIEVNSVPGRNLFHILPDIRETAIKRPVQYAQHLLTKQKKPQ